MSRAYTNILTKIVLLIVLAAGFYFIFNFTIDYLVRDRVKKSTSYHASSQSQRLPASHPATENSINVGTDGTNVGANVGSGTTSTTITQNGAFIEGKNYQTLPARVTTQKIIQDFVAQDPGKIQVIEFFNYGCYWCSKLHPLLREWAVNKEKITNSNIVFYKIPVVFNKQWEVLAKAYYVVNLENKTQLDDHFFKAIHQENQNLYDEKQLRVFFAKQGISEAKFDELYNSFAVNRELSKGNDVGNTYQIAVSPAVIVNTPTGSYFVSPQMTGGVQGVLSVLDFLVEKKAEISKPAVPETTAVPVLETPVVPESNADVSKNGS